MKERDKPKVSPTATVAIGLLGLGFAAWFLLFKSPAQPTRQSADPTLDAIASIPSPSSAQRPAALELGPLARAALREQAAEWEQRVDRQFQGSAIPRDERQAVWFHWLRLRAYGPKANADSIAVVQRALLGTERALSAPPLVNAEAGHALTLALLEARAPSAQIQHVSSVTSEREKVARPEATTTDLAWRLEALALAQKGLERNAASPTQAQLESLFIDALRTARQRLASSETPADVETLFWDRVHTLLLAQAVFRAWPNVSEHPSPQASPDLEVRRVFTQLRWQTLSAPRDAAQRVLLAALMSETVTSYILVSRERLHLSQRASDSDALHRELAIWLKRLIETLEQSEDSLDQSFDAEAARAFTLRALRAGKHTLRE